MMKTLHLHIGSPKTGTTSIQKTFFENKPALKEQGFAYPGNTQNDHFFYFATNSKVEDWPRQFKSMKREKLKKVIENYFSLIKRDFKSGTSDQVISTEYLFISNQEYIKNVLFFLDNFFDLIVVYLFVRSPADYYRSLQQQKVKARSYIKTPTSFRYPFKNVIEAWKEKAEVEVIAYRRGVNSCKVFCNKLGVDWDKLVSLSRNSNTSISIEQMLLLEKIQYHFYQQHENRFKNHLEVIQNINTSFTSKPDLKEETENIICQNHLEDLHWLKEEYDIDFLQDYPPLNELPDLPIYENGKATVGDVYKVPSKQSVERYEALVIDALMKKLVQSN